MTKKYDIEKIKKLSKEDFIFAGNQEELTDFFYFLLEAIPDIRWALDAPIDKEVNWVEQIAIYFKEREHKLGYNCIILRTHYKPNTMSFLSAMSPLDKIWMKDLVIKEY